MTTLRQQLSQPMRGADVRALAEVRATDDDALWEVYSLVFAADKRTADNAAWVLTHLPAMRQALLQQRQAEMIDEAMATPSPTKRRLLLTLLERQEHSREGLRADFLDFCLACMADTSQPTGVHAVAMKLALAQCRHYPELLAELHQSLLLLQSHDLSTGLRNTWQKTLKATQGK